MDDSMRRRQEALMAYNILDTPPEDSFRELVTLAALTCRTPVSCISLIDWDGRRLWIKATQGLTESASFSFDDITPATMFCAQCVRGGDITDGGTFEAPLIIDNAFEHPVYADNPLVQQRSIGFYCGAPITTPNGIPIGTICVVDSKPRTLTSDQIQTLTLLARQVMDHLEHRRQNFMLINAVAERETFRHRLREILDDMLPSHVIDSLRHGVKPPPDYFDPVTVFFSDVVGFTDICASIPPTAVMQILDTLYSHFDRLVAKYNLFKVETIGDAFVCCAGIPHEQPDHTLRIAKFAVEAVEAATKVPIDPEDPSKGCISIRVGFHTGPIVASVVGTTQPRYCLFGETVNTAMAMETSSHAMRINMSREAALALLDQCPEARIEERDVKSVDRQLEMFFLEPESVMDQDIMPIPPSPRCPTPTDAETLTCPSAFELWQSGLPWATAVGDEK
ncbi:hypothetical protein LEN26_005966 [Aphanomyces euteiches]|nr:hypothetical protein AeMF1_003250 [Aphanomyces euteiches]KAH9137009.1 hypothetical protein LEN26_005966 [Aphanomyces euteiches]KAH9195027.1 hypothetical protein AeNC1_002984 [Aphanomyces euteiches]